MASNTLSESTMESKQHAGIAKTPAGACLVSRMAINDNKAGMEGLDKEKINQIIYEASKGSKFYENERKKEEQLDQKIQKLKLCASQIDTGTLHEGKVQADQLLEKLKLERDLSHAIVHVDMDAFYAAVEMRDNPSLRSIPMAVGGKDMLSTSNYLARKFGVRAALPGFIGLKLCPGLVIVKPNFDKYTAVSRDIRQILSLYDPNFCPMSLDEAYLDFTQHLENRNSSLISERTFILRRASESDTNDTEGQNACHCDLNDVLLPSILNSDVLISLISDEVEFQSYIDNFDCDSEELNEGTPTICSVCNKVFPRYKLKVYGKSIEDAVLEIRNRIEQRTCLTASAGIAPNMMLAKICSDKNKPNGQYRILPDIIQIKTFMEDLPIRKVPGIGKVTEKLLGGLDVVKCNDIYSKRSLLYHLFSSTSFHHFLSISLGIGSTTVESEGERKSISTEETFSEISDVAELCIKCQAMCVAVSSDMKQENIKGKTVTLKIKTISFEVMTRSHTLPDLTNDSAVIFNAAKKLLLDEVTNAQPGKLRLRLMGVRMSKLVSSNTEQVTVSSMFNKYKEKEATSSKSHNQIHSLGVSDNEEMEEGEEDFSRPLADKSYPILGSRDSKRNSKTSSLSPKKTKNELKKSDAASSGSVLELFARQKEIQNTQCHNVARGITTEKTPHAVQHSVQNSVQNFLKPSLQKRFRNVPTESSHGTTEDTLENSIYVLDYDDDKAASSSKVHSNSAFMACPICSLRLLGSDLAINRHIDSCLNRQTIQDILQTEKAETHSQSSKNKRPRLEHHNHQKRHPEKVRKVQSSVLSYFQP